MKDVEIYQDVIFDTSMSVKELVDLSLQTARHCIDKAVNDLSRQNDDLSVWRIFDFPDEVKAACLQYLMYFTEFLRDLGIEATASLDDKASEVLFSVAPTNEQDALEKIRLALDVFLKLPSIPQEVYVVSSASQEIELQKLTAAIQHLHSQLMLANATLKTQSLTIQKQDSMLQEAHRGMSQNRLFSGDVVIESITVNPDQNTQGEPLFGGLVVIKKGKLFKGAVEIDFAQFLRKIKQFMKDM